MRAYRKEEFEAYKKGYIHLTVSYWGNKGFWENFNHKTYEEYLETFNKYVEDNKQSEDK